MYSLVSVSYTQLDVYKRQALTKTCHSLSATSLPSAFTRVMTVFGNLILANDMNTILQLAETLCVSTVTPVSYTHLDVYKRQP